MVLCPSLAGSLRSLGLTLRGQFWSVLPVCLLSAPPEAEQTEPWVCSAVLTLDLPFFNPGRCLEWQYLYQWLVISLSGSA